MVRSLYPIKNFMSTTIRGPNTLIWGVFQAMLACGILETSTRAAFSSSFKYFSNYAQLVVTHSKNAYSRWGGTSLRFQLGGSSTEDSNDFRLRSVEFFPNYRQILFLICARGSARNESAFQIKEVHFERRRELEKLSETIELFPCAFNLFFLLGNGNSHALGTRVTTGANMGSGFGKYETEFGGQSGVLPGRVTEPEVEVSLAVTNFESMSVKNLPFGFAGFDWVLHVLNTAIIGL
ncbi:hypothetical protein Tco_0425388 [Tanacetum coccineum]